MGTLLVVPTDESGSIDAHLRQSQRHENTAESLGLQGPDDPVDDGSALGRTTSYRVDTPWTGTVRTNAFADGTLATSDARADGTTATVLPDGTRMTTTAAPDPRFGMMSPLQSTTTRIPSGLTMTEQVTRAVTLTDPSNPLSVSSMTDSVTVNSKTSTTVYDAATVAVGFVLDIGGSCNCSAAQSGLLRVLP